MERFNDLYLNFLKFLNNNFVSLKEQIKPCNNKQFLEDFIELNLPYMEDISVCNIDAFKYKYKDSYLIRGIKFRKFLEKEKHNLKDKINTLWNYLHNLYILAYNTKEFKKIVHSNANLLRILDSHDIFVENIIQNSTNIMNIFKENNTQAKDENNEEEIEEKNNTNENNNTEESKDNSNKEKKEDEENGENDGEEEEKNPFEGTVIGNLAKELSEEIDTKQFEGLKNPSDLFGILLGGGEGSNSLGKIMETVCSKIDQKMKSGELSHQQLLGEAQSMMGNLDLFGGLGNMGNMGNRKKMKKIRRKVHK